MVNFPRYESYQSTEEEWLGDIPIHWQLLRTKSIFRLVAEPAPKNNDEELLSVYSDIGVKPRRELEARGNKASTTDGYWFVKKGDIIVNKLLAWMGAIGVSDYDGVTSPAYDILRAYKPTNSKFYHYLFRNPICIDKLKKHSKGIMEMRLRLYFNEFGDIKIPYPPIEDQDRIVEFLDRKTAEIDLAIAQKQRLIELLKEQKAILIDRAVTKGLNPNAPMRDSGIEWVDEIPGHWSLKRFKHITCLLRDGTHLPPSRTDAGFRLLSVRNIIKDKFVFREDDSFISEIHFKGLCKSFQPMQGDVLLAIVGATLGKVAIVPKTEPFQIQRSLAIFRPNKKISSEYLKLWIQSSGIQNLLWNTTEFSAQPGIYLGALKNFLIVLPSYKEQESIISNLFQQFGEIDKLFQTTQSEIEIFEELRRVFISEAVTGKIKI